MRFNKKTGRVKTSKSALIVGLGLSSLIGFQSFAGQSISTIQQTATVLRFEQAIKRAQKNDPWLTGNRHQQQAVESLSYAANTLPDPKISVGIANLAADSFDFAQEPMSQFKVGITQMFPRGDSLTIKQRQLRQQSEQYPWQREDRKAKVASTVGTLWLDAYYIEQSLYLTQQNRSLFEQLIDLAQANYASTRGKAKQQDVITAQLELTRLEDRLVQLKQQKNRFTGQLSQWLSSYASENNGAQTNILNLPTMVLADELPSINLHQQSLVASEKWLNQQQLVTYFIKHPAVVALDKKLKAATTGVNLAQQKYQPEWGVTASYGYRDDDLMGNERADLLSLGVTFDLPLFTENRQDNEVKAAISTSEVVKTERILLLRKMMASFASSKGRLQQLEQRKSLFNSKLMPQINEQIEASLAAYTHDDGDFSDVVRARISLLNAQIDLLKINVEKQKLALELNYLFIRPMTKSMDSFGSQQATIINNSIAKSSNAESNHATK
ncbi:TolC family protein [Thalassotalea sp. ND16A]|uniref:TolC family protein n=1 Tax=Thalassotalea sp. ND16A TaxID=1535422 RepID=UPI00051CF3E9|nr:TolC family protein [Thalassotalea sp. ND16A]KGK00136.1 hypothetical protein ND16A_0327 [Thalassotalea sp. ND16A]